MKKKISTSSKNKFGSLVSPFRLEIQVGNGVVKLGPGSLSTYAKIKFYPGKPLNGLIADVGNYVETNENVSIHAGGEHLNNYYLNIFFDESPLIKSSLSNSSFSKGPITIGHGCVISSGVQILSGAIIGNRSLVAASSLLTGEFDEYSLLAGVPARAIKQLKEDEFNWFLYCSETISNYFKFGSKTIFREVDKIPVILLTRKVNESINSHSLDFYGIRLGEKEIKANNLKNHHFAYFEQAGLESNNEIIVSDEIFDDLF